MFTMQNIANVIDESNSFRAYCNYWVEHFRAHQNRHCSYRQFAKRTSRASKPLESFQEVVFYMLAYGAQHFQCNYQFFAQSLALQNRHFDRIRVFDYGCGQGIATLALMTYLLRHQSKPIQLEVHLLEPSIYSLEVAELLLANAAKAMNFDIQIHSQNDYLNNFVVPENHAAINIHLLSNILDIAGVQNSLPSFVGKLQTIANENLLWAISPVCGNSEGVMRQVATQCDFAHCHIQKTSQYDVKMFKIFTQTIQKERCERAQLHLSWSL